MIFPYGKQDIQYFNIFDEKLEIEFYYWEDEKDIKEIKNRVKNKFKNVKLIKSHKWDGFK